MASKLRGKMTYANVASTAALVIAVAGGGVAAAAMVPTNSVGSKHIINNSVKSIDIKDNKVTGTDILESSLGQVPSALTANSANTANTANSATTAGTAGAVSNGSINASSFVSGSVGVVRGYAWNNLASPTLNVAQSLNNAYAFNASGGTVTVTRTAVGVYSVTFTGNSWGPGNVQVTAYGAGPDQCKSGGWTAPSATVLCYDVAGAPANSLFTIAVIE